MVTARPWNATATEARERRRTLVVRQMLEC